MNAQLYGMPSCMQPCRPYRCVPCDLYATVQSFSPAMQFVQFARHMSVGQHYCHYRHYVEVTTSYSLLCSLPLTLARTSLGMFLRCHMKHRCRVDLSGRRLRGQAVVKALRRERISAGTTLRVPQHGTARRFWASVHLMSGVVLIGTSTMTLLWQQQGEARITERTIRASNPMRADAHLDFHPA